MFKPMCEGCGAELNLKAGLKKKCLDCDFPLSKKNLEAILSKEGLADQNKPKAASPTPPPPTATPRTEKCRSCGVEFYGGQLKDYHSGKKCYSCGCDPKMEATPTGPSYQKTSNIPRPPPPPAQRTKSGKSVSKNAEVQFHLGRHTVGNPTLSIKLDEPYGRKELRSVFGPTLEGIDRVSGSHFEVYVEEGKYFLKDLDSTNGTIVDGQKIAEHPGKSSAIHTGSRIELAGKGIVLYVTINDGKKEPSHKFPTCWIQEITTGVRFPLSFQEEVLIGRDPHGHHLMHPFLRDIRAHMLASGLPNSEVDEVIQTVSRKHFSIELHSITNGRVGKSGLTIKNFSASGTIIKLNEEQAIKVTDSLALEEVDEVHLNVGKASFKIGQ